MRRKAALATHKQTASVDIPHDYCSPGGRPTADSERTCGIGADRDVVAHPDEAVGVNGRRGPAAVFGDGPGAVVKVGIGPAELAVRFVAEVVADLGGRLGLLGAGGWDAEENGKKREQGYA